MGLPNAYDGRLRSDVLAFRQNDADLGLSAGDYAGRCVAREIIGDAGWLRVDLHSWLA